MDKPKCKPDQLTADELAQASATMERITAKLAPVLKRLAPALKRVADIPTQLAPPGACPFCDERRAKVGAAVRLHRQRKAGKITTGD